MAEPGVLRGLQMGFLMQCVDPMRRRGPQDLLHRQQSVLMPDCLRLHHSYAGQIN